MTIARDPNETPLASLPRNLLDALQAAGVDPQALASQLGLPADSLETGMTFIDADRFFCAAWDAVADPTIGLQAGTLMQPERFGVVGIAAMSSADFGSAVQCKARYWRLIWGDAYEVRLGSTEAAAVLTPSGPVRPYTQAKVDMELASLVSFGRRFTGKRIMPVRLTLCQPPPAWRQRYEEVFGCPVHFSSDENTLVFAREDFALPLLSRNAEVAALMASGAEAALSRLGTSAMRSQVGQVIDRMLKGNEPTLTAVARSMHRSVRTLQRQMAGEEIRFTDVLDERRRAAGERYLGETAATAQEVAFLLGFSTPSSFFRAFKRWTGQTPEEWRRAKLAGKSPQTRRQSTEKAF
ncbi:MAG: AraC family transcriptional regulator [Polaromonas sp.]